MLDQALTDLRLYRAQWRRILSTTLYFLEVEAAGEILYKIGVTQRSVEERIAEITQELRAVAGDVVIRVLYFGHSGATSSCTLNIGTLVSSAGSNA